MWDAKDLTEDSMLFFQKKTGHYPNEKYYEMPEAKSMLKAREQQVKRAIKILQLFLFKNETIVENKVHPFAQFSPKSCWHRKFFNIKNLYFFIGIFRFFNILNSFFKLD